MRVALNEVEQSDDLSMNYVTVDVLKNIMESTDDLNQFADQVTNQIRETISCKTTVLIRCYESKGKIVDQLVSICPKTQLKNIDELFFDDLAKKMKHEKDIVYWSQEEKHGYLELDHHLVDYEDILIFPFDCNRKRVGYLVCLDLDELNNLSTVLELLKSLTGFISMVLQNTILSHQQNQVIEERSKCLVNNELFLDALANVAPVGIFKTDVDGKISYFNQKTLEIFSSSKQNLSGFLWTDLIKNHVQNEKAYCNWIEDTKDSNFHVEFSYYNDDLERCWYVIQITPLSKNADKGFVGIVTDISELKKMEIEMRKLNDELEQRVLERTRELKNSNEKLHETIKNLQLAQEQLVESEKMASLGRLVSGVAHEINTPVGVGVTTSSFLQEEATKFKTLYLSEQMRRVDLENFMNMVLDTSSLLRANLVKASELTRSFKEVAIDQTMDDYRAFNVCEYVEEILLSLKPNLRNTNHHINLYCGQKISISSYPSAFSQIITNFFMNSLIHGFDKFSNGTINVHLKEEQGFLELIYEDNGKGILKSHLPKIYEPFFTTNRSGGNMGLGLHIVYNLVTQKLKGTIVCESRINDYTRMIVRIPI